MNRHLRMCWTVLLLCTSILFCGLWLAERESREDLEQLCRHSAQQAKDRLESFRLQGSAYDYAYAVAELTSYYNSYMLLTIQESGSSNVNAVWLNRLLGVLMTYPELTREQEDSLIEALCLLTADISDDNAYQILFGICNGLTR